MGNIEVGIQNEIALWQIIRYHNDRIKITIELSPMFGTISYFVTMNVDGKDYFFQGRHLQKRYCEMIKKLNELGIK